MRLILTFLLGAVLWDALDIGYGQSSCQADEEASRKIVFVAGNRSHGYGAHEHYAGCRLLAQALEQAMPGYEVVVHQNGWPEDPSFLDDADTLVIYSDGGGGHPVIPHLEQVDGRAKQGMGVVCIHYAVEIPKGEPGDHFLDWIGGYFEAHWSVNPHWIAKFTELPDHPITRGVAPFEIDDEWYYHMRFPEAMVGVTPILTATPPASTLSRPDGAHSGNPHVRAKAGQPQHVAWAKERPEGGRGFGFTGGHHHWNWGDPNFRRLVLNAIVWTAQGEVPEGGITDQPVRFSDLEANQDFPPPENFNREEIQRRLKLPSEDRQSRTDHGRDSSVDFDVSAPAPPRVRSGDNRDPQLAVEALDVAEGLEATLFASEPDIMSLTNLDIDHRGRVWVCEVVNYRRHNGSRAEGDRILILEDTTGDGIADKTKVFYQGRDIDSAMGICVLGNKVIVSASPHVIVFTDENGDDAPDRKELLFTETGQPQHDHSAHSFVFGPDGYLYWNFGNTGQKVCDADGNVVVDLAGNEVVDNGKPYFGGMPFRCRLDGSQFEVLAHNFRNNYEVAVDSFGTLWQSDNDDDGNRGVRINFVMEHGNYGYRDEMTGAGWQSPRTNMEPDVPSRHWYQNDPGVVPNLLQTGAGSPTGIAVYEGRLLPKVFWDQMIHCDAGPSIVRAYPVAKEGAGYSAEIVNLVHGARDDWFRPADVCVAPDGSLFITDWYDPGVGGHNMQDLDRGRLFRIAPPGHDYRPPEFNFDTVEGAVEALKSPNLSARYLAFTALTGFDGQAEDALLEMYRNDENPRLRARALWVLGELEGKTEHYARLALRNEDPDLRIVGLRLARRAQLDVISLVAGLLSKETDPQVLRECAIALRHNEHPQAAKLWGELANLYDGEDRWYLEALGIAADRQWDSFLESWMEQVGSTWNTKAGRDIVWRSRAERTPELLAKLIASGGSASGPLPRYFRAMDFQEGPRKPAALIRLAFGGFGDDDAERQLVVAESLGRLSRQDIQTAEQKASLHAAFESIPRSEQFVSLVGRFEAADRYPAVLTLAQHHVDGSIGVQAVRLLLAKRQHNLLRKALRSEDLTEALATAQVLSAAADGQGAGILLEVARDESRDLELRRLATYAAGRTVNGARQLIHWRERNELPIQLNDAAASALNGSNSPEIREIASRLFPLPPSKDDAPIPPLQELTRIEGDALRGQKIFASHGECAKCHVVGREGKEVGPALTEIGSKLSRQALFESILFPSAGISHNYETYAVELKDGNLATGTLVSRTNDEILIRNAEAIVQSYRLTDVDQVHKLNVSLMPADLQKAMTVQELVDVVEYLTTLNTASGPASSP